MRDNEDNLLRSVALQNSQAILLARQRAEEELLRLNETLERRTEELANSLAVMRATLEATTDGVLVTDGAGAVSEFNGNYLRMWQVPPRCADGQVHHDLLKLTESLFADRAAFRARIEEIYESSPPETYDLLELEDGRFIERFSRIQRIDERGVGRVWSFRDITERKRAEEQLRDETRILELLNKTGTAIASTLDLQTLLQTVTDAATQLSNARFGAFFYTATDDDGGKFQLYSLSGAPREAFENFGHPRATALFGPTFHGEAPIRCDDVLLDPRYGKMAPHYGMPKGHLPVRSYLGVPVVSRTGEVLGGLFFGHPEPGIFTERTERIIGGVAAQAAVAIDNAQLYAAAQNEIAERKRAEEALRAARDEALEASRAKSTFLANMSHELRTPLNAIIGYTELVREDAVERGDQRQKGDLDKVVLSAKHLLAVIGDILDLSRIEAGKLELTPENVDPVEAVREAVMLAAPLAERRGNSIAMDISCDLCCVHADRTRLRQVLFNLLSNASKFTESGSITVSCERADAPDGSRWVEISVSDNGIGMATDQMGRLFRMFEQLDSATTRQRDGAGLGLVISKRLVEMMDGDIVVESEPGRGSSFRVRLPAV